MSKSNKALKDSFTPLAECKPDGIILHVFPVGQPENDAETLCFDDARALKNHLKKNKPPEGMAYGIRDADLSGLSIKTLDMHNGYLENVNLSGSEIRLAAFAGVTLTNVNFSHADVKQLVLRDGLAKGCNFDAAQLPGCNMIGALLEDCDFRYADISNSRLRDSEFKGGKLEGADMAGADMSNVQIKDVNAQKVRLEHVDMDGGEFSDTDFSGGDMRSAMLNDVNMIACDLRGVQITGGEKASGMALAGCKYDHGFTALIEGKSLYDPRVGAKALWAVRKKSPAPK